MHFLPSTHLYSRQRSASFSDISCCCQKNSKKLDDAGLGSQPLWRLRQKGGEHKASVGKSVSVCRMWTEGRAQQSRTCLVPMSPWVQSQYHKKK